MAMPDNMAINIFYVFSLQRKLHDYLERITVDHVYLIAHKNAEVCHLIKGKQ